MALPRTYEARTLYRAAERRLADAQALLDASVVTGAHTTGAMYLGGYAVECILGCLILQHAALNKHSEMLQAIFDSRHNLETLKEIYRKVKGPMMPREEAKCFIRSAGVIEQASNILTTRPRFSTPSE